MGVGPLGMLLVQIGHKVYGYDDYPDRNIVERLQSHGILMLEHLHGSREYDEVIVTRAIQHTPERLKRLEKRFPGAKISFRGDYLANLAKTFKTVVIAGTHGKTSTTANLVSLLHATGEKVSYVLGGYFAGNALDAARFDATSSWLILEVDESDGTIEKFKPQISAITNIELDHVDYYQSESKLLKVFRRLISKTKTRVFLSEAAANALSIDPHPKKRKQQVVLSEEAVNVFEENHKMAKALAEWITEKKIEIPLSELESIERRQEILKLSENRTVVTDYAHHPSELAALRDWLNSVYPEAFIQWIYQPHRYSRTIALKREFVEVLKTMKPCVLPEYGAFEAHLEEGSSGSLVAALQAAGADAHLCKTPAQLTDCLDAQVESNREVKPTVIVFAGAGDILLWRDWWVHGLNHFGGGVCYSEFHKSDELWRSFHHERMQGDGSYVACDEPLKRKTTLNVGGAARFYAEPATLESLQLVLKTSRMLHLDVQLIGKGSNLLVSEAGFDGVVIRLNKEFWSKCEYLGGGRYWLGAGLSLKKLCRAALEQGVSGFNFLDGIPGSVGGAVRMNAGAMGSEFSERILEVECLDFTGKRLKLTREEMGFRYRHCELAEELIVLHALVQGRGMDEPENLKQGLEVYRKKRLFSQPAEPSAGCMFKNPKGDSAGRLIDAAGLKGFRIGGASVSRKHGNFLVTSKDTYPGDVLAVIEHVRVVVEEQFSVKLEQEIQMFPPRKLGGDVVSVENPGREI